MSTSKRQAQGSPVRYRVTLRRRNGRYIRSYPASSRYAAKRIVRRLEERYDETYYAEIEPAKANDNGATATDPRRAV